MNLLTLESVLTQLVAWVKSLFVQPDYAQNDSTQPDYIKNRTHYVESVSTSDVWYQTNVEVGSGTSSPGAYSGTFTLTTGKTYNVTITNGSNSKTYEGVVAEYSNSYNAMLINKNWSNPMQGAETTNDAFYILVQASNIILASVDVNGSGCTVQVSEVTENVHKLDPKFLPDNVNQLDSVTTSKSGKVTTVTFAQTNGAETQFQVTDGADGTNGKSAYQVAVDNGYSGTEAQWLASLKGADGVSLGEVELTQEVTTATDSVPANKAVYDKVQRLTETDIEDILATGEAKEPTLPLGYTELEWIYNENGSSGIDTGLIPNDANWRFVGSWARMKTSGGNWAAIFRAYTAEGYNTYRIIRNNNKDNQVLVYNHCATSAGKQIALSNTAVDIWHTFDLSYGSITLDGTTTSLNTTQGTANTATLKLVDGSYYVKFKTFKAYHNDVLVGNFVPAKRDSDGEIGMYDTVTNTFFEHINSNSLVGGPEIGGGRDKILNGEGLANAISTTLENPNKLPTVQAVKDGIEVWRDDIEYIYKASDLTFDGTNYVDTGWSPYNPEGDFYIKMEISDLVLAGMENSAMIISCCKQISPYPGFAIRRDATNNSQIAVYIDGTGRWNTTVNTGAGSKNTIVFSRVGNVYTFQVNGGVENTFTSTTIYNVDATNLYIGAQLNADLTTFYRYGKFHLDSLVIARHEAEGVQLYSDYKKVLKIYPKAKANDIEGLDAAIREGNKNTVVISPDCVVRGTRTPLTSVDKYKFDGLNTIEVVFKGVPSTSPLNWFESKTLCEIKKDDSNYIRWSIDGYNCKALIVVGGETFLSQTFTINSGTPNLNQYVNYAATINLYQKVMRIIGADRDDGSIVVIYEVDISNVDISSFEGSEVNINSHIYCYWSDYYCIYVRVNCYDEIGGQLNTKFYSGHYNIFPTYNLESKLGYNEYITGLGLGGTITEKISPTHKKCSATNQSGYFRISPTVSLADSVAPDHLSWSVKFKLLSGNITITSGAGGAVRYIRDTNGNNVTTIEQGVEYILYVREGDNNLSYSLTNGVRASGTFELEVWEPKLFFQQSQIICAETWNGSMFTGAIPYSATPNFRQIVTKDALTGGVWFPIGELRLSGTNIQMFNGTTWKQINNS